MYIYIYIYRRRADERLRVAHVVVNYLVIHFM